MLCERRDDTLVGRPLDGPLSHKHSEQSVRPFFNEWALAATRLHVDAVAGHAHTVPTARWRRPHVGSPAAESASHPERDVGDSSYLFLSSEIAVEAEGLVKSFKDTKALKGVSFQVPRGKVLGVLGPNGAGKTTAVRILATLLRPDAGRAIVAGYDVVRNPREVRKRVGLTGQYASVDEELTGREIW